MDVRLAMKVWGWGFEIFNEVVLGVSRRAIGLWGLRLNM
jgi:hypothetical protein